MTDAHLVPDEAPPKQEKRPREVTRIKMSHERTATGRALLQQKRDLDRWVEANRASAPAAEIEAAEMLACNLYSAATNGLAMERAALLAATDRISSHHYSRSQGGRRG